MDHRKNTSGIPWEHTNFVIEFCKADILILHRHKIIKIPIFVFLEFYMIKEKYVYLNMHLCFHIHFSTQKIFNIFGTE